LVPKIGDDKLPQCEKVDFSQYLLSRLPLLKLLRRELPFTQVRHLPSDLVISLFQFPEATLCFRAHAPPLYTHGLQQTLSTFPRRFLCKEREVMKPKNVLVCASNPPTKGL